MADRLALCDFLDGIYEVGDTTYALTDVISDRQTGTPVVDSNGLVALSFPPGVQHQAQAAGPFLAEWFSLFNGEGFTCIMSYSADSDGGNNFIVAIDSGGGPGQTNLITGPSNDTTEYYYYTVVTTAGYNIVSSPNPTPPAGVAEIAAWQLGLVETSITTNGGPVASAASGPFGPNTEPNITFWDGNSPMHIQWIGLYDATVTLTPGLSRGKPPPVISSGPPLLVGGGVMRRIKPAIELPPYSAPPRGPQAARGRLPSVRRPAWRRRQPPQ